MLRTRRDMLRIGIGSAGTLLLPGAGFLPMATAALAGAPAGGATDDAHFFLMIVLNGGADSSYMFDARPLSMTKAGKIQNYLGQEPMPWIGSNGVTTLASPLVKPLEPFRDRFSVLNGVTMTPSFDGHLQNMNFLFTGNPFGGDSFIPHLNLADTGRAPRSLDSVLSTDSVVMTVNNHSSVVPLRPGSVGGLAATLKQIKPLLPGSELSGFIRGRLAANAAGPGRMAAGASLMLSGLDQAPRVHDQLAHINAPARELDPDQQTLALISQCFRLAISRSAIYVPPEFFDVHAPEQAKDQPKLFGTAIGRVAALLRGLVETPYDDKRSMLDVTTVMVASEMGRTLRAEEAPIDQTGTHHNQFANSILLAGKGIRGGLVVGATDLGDERAKVSKAHLALDPELYKAMGRPFDFATLRARPDLPDAYDVKDYLTIGSVVNTIYGLFDVPKEHYRTPGRDAAASPMLQGLLV